MLFHSTKVPLKVFSILFKSHSVKHIRLFNVFQELESQMKIEKRNRTNNVITVNVTLTTKIQKLYAAKSRINDTAHVSGSPLPMTFWKDRCTGQDRVHQKKKKTTKLLILIARFVMILFFALQQNMISGQHVIFSTLFAQF